MTAEKAIEILSGFGIINRYCTEDAEALDMAIKALEQQPCEDCISREATIEAIYKKYIGGKDAIKNAPINDLYAEGLAEAVDAVWELPSVTPKAGWIPCAERLPEKAKARYWICTDGGYQCQCRWTNDVYGLGEGDRWAWKIFDIPQYSKVVAWMPLPKPYKAETKIEQGLNFADQDTMMPAT